MIKLEVASSENQVGVGYLGLLQKCPEASQYGRLIHPWPQALTYERIPAEALRAVVERKVCFV